MMNIIEIIIFTHIYGVAEWRRGTGRKYSAQSIQTKNKENAHLKLVYKNEETVSHARCASAYAHECSDRGGVTNSHSKSFFKILTNTQLIHHDTQ
jgi:hypothetical protein